jgi:ribosomal protein S18 acetylase RimI-like enzyme
MNKEIKIEVFKGGAIEEAASVVATAMLNNPLHLAVFKSNDEKSHGMQAKLFAKVFGLSSCNIVVAKHSEKIVGVMNYYLPGKCQVTTIKTITMLPGLIAILGSKLPGVLEWKTTWARHDPQSPHLHFGPLAVLPNMQHRGIGSALLNHFCRIADAQKVNAYLETDKEENVRLYEKFDFNVIGTNMVCRVTNWFMRRDAQQVSEMTPLHRDDHLNN